MITFPFEKVFPRAKQNVLPAFERECERFRIDTKDRLAGFLAQVSHESIGLTSLEEKTNFTADNLMRIWPSRFKTRDAAERYARLGGKAILNYVYGSRMGNGPASSGDGYLYRGRTPIMLTGRENYRLYGKILGIPLEENPDLAADLEKCGVAISAAYWDHNGCNQLMDRLDLMEVCRRINGGTIGFKEREAEFYRVRSLLGKAA